MNVLAKHYGQLTPEERFRLIRAAEARGDEFEADRLANTGSRIALSMPVHSPFALAFHEFLFLTYIELLEGAAHYLEVNDLAGDELCAAIAGAKDAETEDDGNDDETDEREKEKATTDDGAVAIPPWARAAEVAYAAGFMFKVKMAGWKLFCERWNTAPTLLWELADFPGLDRLNRAMALVEAGTAYPTPADMVRWLNSIRQVGAPEATEAGLMNAVRFADDLDAGFRERVPWWGG